VSRVLNKASLFVKTTMDNADKRKAELKSSLGDDTVNLVCVGDIMLARQVAILLKRYGYEYPFLKIGHVLQNADIAFGNLESPFTLRGNPMPNYDPNVTFRADPEGCKALAKVGFKVLSIANNHINDYGAVGLKDTIANLDDEGIKAVGAGENATVARAPAILECKGIKVGFLAYTQLQGRAIFPASRMNPGVAQFRTDHCKQDIKKLRDKADVIVLSVHWGYEYCPYPSSYHQRVARELIGEGCDLILGHHPHIVQGWERHDNGLIFYSLGNFIFDEPNPETKKSVILEAKLNSTGVVFFNLIPAIDNGSCCPEITKGDEKVRMLKRIQELTDEYRREDWVNNFDRDPTDKMLWNAMKRTLMRGCFPIFRNFPFSVWMHRGFPLLQHKFAGHVLKSASRIETAES